MADLTLGPGYDLKVWLCDVGPWQEIVDPAVGITVDDPGEHLGEIAEWLDFVELAGLDQRSYDGPVLGAAVIVRPPLGVNDGRFEFVGQRFGKKTEPWTRPPTLACCVFHGH